MQIKVRVTPGAKHDAIEKRALGGKDVLFVSVKAKAEGGAANDRLRELLAAHFDTSIKNIRLVSGHNSMNKLIEVK